MKYLICSDIHGSVAATKKLLAQFKELNCDFFIHLGDVHYFGPRNPFPEEYCPKEVATMLNGIKDKIIAVRGNCDSEVDQMLLEFPMMSDYAIVLDNGHRLFLTHGHIFSPEKLPYLSKGDFFFSGHTHERVLKEKDGVTICNPNSASLPKDGNPASFVVYENEKITFYNL